MSFISPIGSKPERKSGKIWPGRWEDATGYAAKYELGFHTGADLNLNFPHWDADRHAEVYAIGAGTVTYAGIYSTQYWGGIVVIDHGVVDELPLFSRYGHVENIKVKKDQTVETGDRIASVGNGEGLFAYHLHFDISKTKRLLDKPGDWPGPNEHLVYLNYVDPQKWLQDHVSPDEDAVIPPTQYWKVIATQGLRVREKPGTSKKQVGSLPFGAIISIEDDLIKKKDTYQWGKIYYGKYSGDWVAMGKADQSEIYLAKYP